VCVFKCTEYIIVYRRDIIPWSVDRWKLTYGVED